MKVNAFILALAKAGKEKEILKELSTLEEVKETWNTYGDYDIIIKTETEDLTELNEFLKKS